MVYDKFRRDDPLNLNRSRTVKNTDGDLFNCAGYALECFSWYCPEGCGLHFDWDTIEEAKEKNMQAFKNMVKDFPDLKIIDGPNAPIEEGYYRLGFRIASGGDFHYIKQMPSGRWFHKPGCFPIQPIKRTDIEKAWPGWNWEGRYDGPILWMANKR